MNKFILLALCALPSVALAQSKSASLSQTAQVLSSCSISTLQNINFGVVDVLNDTSKTGAGSVRTACTKGSYALTVNYGTNSLYFINSTAGQGTTYRCGARSMANGKGSKLPYQLYTNSDLTNAVSTFDQIMISGGTYVNTPCKLQSAWTNVVFNTPAEQTLSLYGQMTVDTAASAGNYTDMLTISLTF